jgi:putative transposase
LFIPFRAPKSISSFVAGFKAAVVCKIDDYIDEHQLPLPKYNKKNPLWLSNYHDHIVRIASGSWGRIEQYINDNPKKWGRKK